MPDPVFTKNETLSLMHEAAASDLRDIVSFIKKHNLTVEQIIRLLEEIADQSEAQSIVVDLRDKINPE
jgi:hypothetical protein